MLPRYQRFSLYLEHLGQGDGEERVLHSIPLQMFCSRFLIFVVQNVTLLSPLDAVRRYIGTAHSTDGAD